MKILSLCDLTGNLVRPWAAAGYECWCVDLQHPPGVTYDGRILRISADVTTWRPPPRMKFAFVAAFPPCTHLAVSGALHFKAKGLRALIEALTVVNACKELCENLGSPYFIENPVSTLSSYWRKPDFIFNPCDYGGYLNPPGDAYTKKTCLWTGNGFVMPLPVPVPPIEGSKMHRLPPSADRANLRSATPMGFAHAVFLANSDAHKVRKAS